MHEYEIFMRPTDKPGADDVSLETTDNLDYAFDVAEGWVINMGAHLAWVVERPTGRIIIGYENDGSIAYKYADTKPEAHDDNT